MVTPAKYTATEGGIWMDWGAGPVSLEDLRRASGPVEVINGRKVFALYFADGRIWDCLHWWRT
jgi:hypothetical protein